MLRGGRSVRECGGRRSLVGVGYDSSSEVEG